MTLAAINFLSFDAVAIAFGQWCRRFAVKDLMADFGVAEQTAKKWRQGNLPDNKSWVAMVELWGETFLLHVFAPALARLGDDDLGRDLEVIEAKVSLLRERIKHERHRATRKGTDAVAGGGAVEPAGDSRPDHGGIGQRPGRCLAGEGAGVAGLGSTRARRILTGAVMLFAVAWPLAADLWDAVADPSAVALDDYDDDRFRRARAPRLRIPRALSEDLA